jgi:hypothetical protein
MRTIAGPGGFVKRIKAVKKPPLASFRFLLSAARWLRFVFCVPQRGGFVSSNPPERATGFVSQKISRNRKCFAFIKFETPNRGKFVSISDANRSQQVGAVVQKIGDRTIHGADEIVAVAGARAAAILGTDEQPARAENLRGSPAK